MSANLTLNLCEEIFKLWFEYSFECTKTSVKPKYNDFIEFMLPKLTIKNRNQLYGCTMFVNGILNLIKASCDNDK